MEDNRRSELLDRSCCVCGSPSDGAVLVLKENINLEALDTFGFASRKPPENQHHQIVQCKICDVWYASPVLNEEMVCKLYKEASFDTGDEAAFAAKTYGQLLLKRIGLVPDKL